MQLDQKLFLKILNHPEHLSSLHQLLPYLYGHHSATNSNNVFKRTTRTNRSSITDSNCHATHLSHTMTFAEILYSLQCTMYYCIIVSLYSIAVCYIANKMMMMIMTMIGSQDKSSKSPRTRCCNHPAGSAGCGMRSGVVVPVVYNHVGLRVKR